MAGADVQNRVIYQQAVQSSRLQPLRGSILHVRPPTLRATRLRGDPNHAETHLNRAVIWLLQGKWEQGWPEYEWRWRTKTFARHALLSDGAKLAADQRQEIRGRVRAADFDVVQNPRDVLGWRAAQRVLSS